MSNPLNQADTIALVTWAVIALLIVAGFAIRGRLKDAALIAVACVIGFAAVAHMMSVTGAKHRHEREPQIARRM